MSYIRDHARFSILDDMPADVWHETSPAGYLCIIDEEPADYHGNFNACAYSANLYQLDHVPVSVEYLRDRCTLADEPTARKIIAHYLRIWAIHEDDDAADILRDEADRIASAPMFDAMRQTRDSYHANAESITYTSGESGPGWRAAPGYGASIYTDSSGRIVATVGEIWKPTTFDAVCLINQTRRTFTTRDAARNWAGEQATAHGYPIKTDRPAYDLFTI